MPKRLFAVHRLTLPRELEVSAVAAVLSSIAAMQRPLGLFGFPVIGFEVRATNSGIEHLLLVEPHHETFVLGQLRTHISGLRVEPEKPTTDRGVQIALGAIALQASVQIGVELRMTHHGRLLRPHPEEISTAILAALGSLKPTESVTIQWMLAPRIRPKPGILPDKGGQSPDGVFPERDLVRDMERLRARERKLIDPLLSGIGRLAVSAATGNEAKALTRRVLAAVRSSEAPGVRLLNRFICSSNVVKRVRSRDVPLLDWGLTLNVQEAAGLLALPYGNVVAEGVRVGSSAQLPPRSEIASGELGAVTLGMSSFPGLERRAIALKQDDRLQHLHVMGPTGTGKSTLLANICLQDIEAGRGLVVLDPKGDLVRDLLARIPKHREGDVIILDPMDDVLPVGFNPLWVKSRDRHVIDRAVDFVVGTLHQLYEKTWGPRTEDTLRAACLSLVLAGDEERPYTLCDLSELLVGSKEFRGSIVSKLSDRDLLLFWAWFEKLPQPEKLTMLGPVLNKLRAFTLRIAIRNVIGQPKGLDLNEVLASGKILLVPLPKGVIGQETAALLGSLLVSSLWQAALERAALPSAYRPPVMVTLDEVQEFLRLPGDLGDVLTQARGLGVGMTLAHQHLGQLPKELAAAIAANARSKVFFQLSDADAKAIAPLSGGWLSPQDFSYLPVREAVLIPLVDSQVMPPCTIRTLPLAGIADNTRAEEIRNSSAATYGQAPVVQAATQPMPMASASGPRRRYRPKSTGTPAVQRPAASPTGTKRAPLSGDKP